MSKPIIKTEKTKKGRTYRVSLCSLYTIGRKRFFFIVDEVRRDNRVRVTTVEIPNATARGAAAHFDDYAKNREKLESQLSPMKFAELEY